MIIGADFINTVKINFKKGIISINPICESTIDDELRSEIFIIDVTRDRNTIDFGVFSKPENKHIVTELVNNYKPVRTREIDKIILKKDEPVY